MRIARSLIILFVLGLSLSLLHVWMYPGALSANANTTNLFYIVGLVLPVVLISAALRLRGIGLVAVVTVLAVTGYAYRFEIQSVAQHVLGALMPYRDEQVGEASVSFEAWPDGEFRIDALVNGTLVRFVVDTGASEVVLTPRDAEHLGYHLNDLDFSNVSMTANGLVGGAPIVLSEIAIGPIRMHDVAAAVNGAPMPYSLLGLSLLNRLDSYEVKEGILTLTQYTEPAHVGSRMRPPLSS
jgi:aspartyl protease family protein